MSKPNRLSKTHRQLLTMFATELQQAWWAEALAKLRDEKRAAASPKELQAIEDRIREHYQLRHTNSACNDLG